MIASTQRYQGYTIELRYDQDAGNPIKDFDELATIVLHDKAEHRFGWTSDDEYASLLTHGLEKVRTARSLGQALAIVIRWLKAYHGVTVALPFGAIDHSGVAVYLGSGHNLADPGGWDSGWVGLVIDTPARRKVMGFDKETLNPDGEPRNSPEAIERALREDFKQFSSWVEGDVYGYIVTGPDGDEVDSCWGYYGSDDALEQAREVVRAEIAHRHGEHVAMYKRLVEAKR